MKSALKKVFGLSFIWFGVWAFFIFYLEPHGVDYIHNYLFTCLYFLLAIIYLTTAFKEQIGAYVEKFSPTDLLIMAIFSLSVSLIYYFTALLSQHSPLAAFSSHLPSALALDYRFLLTKSFEIMFQQCFFMVSIYYLFNNNVSKKIDMLVFGCYTFLIHIPIYFIPDTMGKVLLPVSFFAGIIFSYCITKSKRGFMWSYMIHYGFYVLLAVTFWFFCTPQYIYLFR